MNFSHTVILLGAASALTGCTTSSKVQEMIDASHRDYTQQLQSHEESIDVLRQSAKAGLEKSSSNGERLGQIEKQLVALNQQMIVVQDLANASKVMSAANTVKVSDLEDRMSGHEEENEQVLGRMAAIDQLYEEVLIRQFQEIAESAAAAIETLRANGFSSTTNAPVLLDEPIEIMAPDTTAPTNGSPPE